MKPSAFNKYNYFYQKILASHLNNEPAPNLIKMITIEAGDNPLLTKPVQILKQKDEILQSTFNDGLLEIVIEKLNNLLMSEYLQRDLYETYNYLMFGPEAIGVKEHLEEHLDEEMQHIEILQRYIVSFGGFPTVSRMPIEDLSKTNNVSLRGIMCLDLKHELQAVKDYHDFLKFLEEYCTQAPFFTSLRIDVENIMVQEQEHVHDLQRWLKN